MFPPQKQPALGQPPIDPMGGGLPPLGAGGPPPSGPPFGASLPTDPAGDMSGSPLLQALAASFGGGDQDPLAGAGTGDPNMGAMDLLQMLGLGQAGVGGPGGPGAPPSFPPPLGGGPPPLGGGLPPAPMGGRPMGYM